MTENFSPSFFNRYSQILLFVMFFPLSVAGLAQNNEIGLGSPRQINVTRDSEPGWVPSVKLESQAKKAAEKYFEKFDTGKFEDAYAMLAEIFQQNAPQSQFVQYGEKILLDAGTLVTRRFLKITWTKDPPGGPIKGIFAAIDFTGKYEKADRNCGYIVLHQPPKMKEFKVIRIENNYLSNSMAKKIVKSKSQKVLDELWSQMSSNCPNYSVN
jgi:Protein of unknown function (DUF4019)